ncbi:Ig-like domain-containing protein [Candidatus Entotheonella palauensis]|uniref:Ig-like domain-containing protein n=1 Tax=Candidatus Entotheonella palauensis TaxID=93172 RepID=UPI0015C4521B|nr:Ig-like domain-containing protein [Candidatus Entotheonella palauensis]
MTSVRSAIVLTTLSLLLACLLVLSGCGKAELDRVDIEPGSASLTVGDTQQFKATPIDTNGEAMEDVAITWSVDGDSGSIDAAGLFTAVKPGQVNVVAATETSQHNVPVTIAQEPVADLQVVVTPETVVAGEQAQLMVTVNNSAGQGIADVAVEAKGVTNGTDVEPKTANTNASGQVTFTIVTPANVQNNQVEVSAGGQTATADLPTTAGPPAMVESGMERDQVVAGQEAKVEVVVRDQANNPVPGAQVTFSASGEGSSVTPAQAATDDQGRASAVLKAGPSAGASQVQVSVAGLEPQVSAFQSMPDVASQLTLQSDMPAIIAGGTVNLAVNVADTHGNAIANATVQLEASPEGATLEASTLTTDASGAAATALKLSATPGANTVTATVLGVEPAQLTITGREPAEIRVSPATATVEMLGTQAFSAVAEDVEGHSIAVTPEWQVIGENGTIDAEGTFQATGLGEATVLGVYGDLKDGAQVSIITGQVASVEVTPSEQTVTAGENFQFQAQAFNANRHPLDVTPNWSVSNDVGEIDAVGLFTAKKAGEGHVIATADEQSGQAKVTVIPGALTVVKVEPQAISLKAGESVQLQAQGFDATDNEVALEPVWSLTADLGELSADGTFKALRTGSGEIVAEAGPTPTVIAIPVEVTAAELERVEVDPSTLTVSAGAQHVFEATGYDAFDNRIEVEPEWTLSEEGIGQIDAQGSFYARQTGSVQLSATVGESKGEASITVKPDKLARLTIQPTGPLTLSAGTTVSFTLSGFDAYDNSVALEHEWVQTEPLGTISPDGFFRAETVGSGNLMARQGDLNISVPITVTPGKLSEIQLTPSGATMQAGNSQKWQAEGFDAYGNAVEMTPTWRVSESIGDMTEEGVFTAQQARTGQVIASAEGISGSVEITVEPGTLKMLSVTPEQLSLTAGETSQMIVVGYDAYGNPTPVEPVWHVPGGMGQVSADNVFTAQKAGTGRLIIAAKDLAEIVDISVEIGSLARLVVQPESAEMASGAQQTFTAQGFDAGGNPVPVEVVWGVDGDHGTITAEGVFTATQMGSGQVQAVSNDIVGAAEVTVTAGPAVALQLTVPSPSVRAGASMTLGSNAQDAAGNAIATAPGWSVEGDIGTITPEGVFTAQKAGSGQIVGVMGDVTQTIDIDVQPGDLVTIEVSPKDPALTAGETITFTAMGYDALGNEVPVEVTWSAQGGIGTIDAASGSFQATTAGTGAVVAINGVLAGVAMVNVKPGKVAQLQIPSSYTVAAGEDVSLKVTAVDAFNNPTEAAYQWELTGKLGQLSDGKLHGERAGTAELVVYSGDVEARSTLEVTPGKIARIQIEPDVLDLKSGEQVQLRAFGFDAYGNATDVDAAWALDGEVGSLTASGAFIAGQAGTGRVTAQLGDLQAAAGVTVAPGAVQRLELEPVQAQVASSTTQAFAAKGYDAADNEVPVDVQWAMSSEIGTIDSNGQFTGTRVGKGTLVAYAAGVVATADLAVTPGPVALVFVTPQPVQARAGEDISFEAQGFDAHHNTIPALQTDWQVAGKIGTINAQTGVFSATHVGQGKVVVSVGESRGSADVEISPGTPDADQSRLVSSRLDVLADGETSADIIVHVQDRFGNPVMDAQVFLVSSRDDIIEQPVPTNQHGIALGHIRSKIPGTSEIIAVVDSIRISNPIQLTFKADGASG